jgi:hypothetical protein
LICGAENKLAGVSGCSPLPSAQQETSLCNPGASEGTVWKALHKAFVLICPAHCDIGKYVPKGCVNSGYCPWKNINCTQTVFHESHLPSESLMKRTCGKSIYSHKIRGKREVGPCRR